MQYNLFEHVHGVHFCLNCGEHDWAQGKDGFELVGQGTGFVNFNYI